METQRVFLKGKFEKHITLLALGGVSLGKTHFYTGFVFPKGFFPGKHHPVPAV